jgi:superfamily I DNA and RNA helicase
VLTGSEALQRKPRRPAQNPASRAAKLRQVEERMLAFDLEQHRVAVSVPSGPQRIRGLAGTGKTVVLAMKAAYMHVRNPDWQIAFSFYSRSLYGQIKQLITRFVVHFSQGTQATPRWDKLLVLHGWGASGRPGLYSTLCAQMGIPFRPYQQALQHFSTTSAKVALSRACEELLIQDVPDLFDAILVDEAQDFGPGFFRLCHAALHQPKRLIWGYDEVQSLEDLDIPTAESLFGVDENGDPVVDLSGVYPGDIEKDLILYHCYRNPRPILLTAHVFGLGLLRPEGALQFIDTAEGWRDIGYDFEPPENGDLKTGQMATLVRPKANSPHLLEDIEGYRNLIQKRVFSDRTTELEWIAEDIARNLTEEELRPHEIAVITFEPYTSKAELSTLQTKLLEYRIRSAVTGHNTGADVFWTENHVTLTHVYRAKGNEASLVYVYGFERMWWPKQDYQTIRRRNLAFTAMTRSKGWLVLTGIGESAERQFAEIDRIQEQVGRVTFKVPDMRQIQRNLETYENQRRRVRLRKAQQTLGKLIDDLKDVDISLLPESQRSLLLDLLLNERKP